MELIIRGEEDESYKSVVSCSIFFTRAKRL